MSLPAKALLALIQIYKWTLSPFIGRDCRYLPTCSSYAADAVRAHGAWAGSWMALARLCRCHPFGGSGYDPAPQTTNGEWWAPWTYGDWRGGERAVPSEASETSPSMGEVARSAGGGDRGDVGGEPQEAIREGLRDHPLSRAARDSSPIEGELR